MSTYDELHSVPDRREPGLFEAAGAAAALRELIGDDEAFDDLVDSLPTTRPGDMSLLFASPAGRILFEIAVLSQSAERSDQAYLVDLLVNLMAWDEPLFARQLLIDLLAEMARRDVGLVASRLESAQWFITRNLLIALTKAKAPDALVEVRDQLRHPEERVRVEALRCLGVLEPELTIPDLIEALSDPSRRVREAAVTLLRARPSPNVVVELERYVRAGRPTVVMAERAVAIIAGRQGPEARAALSAIASMRSLKPSRRAARSVAREHLAARSAAA